MMRFIVLFFVVISLDVMATDIDRKIKKTHHKLTQYSLNYSKLNKKMAQTAKAILQEKRDLNNQERFLQKLKTDLALKELTYKGNIAQLKLLKKSQERLNKQQESIEEKLTQVIVKTVSISILLNKDFAQNEASLIASEVLKSMLQSEKKRAKDLSQKFMSNAKNIDLLDKNAKELEVAIATIDQKRKQLLQTEKANKKALQKLTHAKASYKKELKRLLKRQNTLKETLSKLNIIKIDRIKRAKERAARKKAFQKKKIVLENNLPKVQRHGSSYQRVKTIKYRGRKTIAPLDSYSITKKYGTYTDPIYGIKIFNESISLKPRKQNARVKTVFNGKVIYADKTAVLNYIVIVEHKNGLHTIYANLSQISPNIRVGKKIKRGYTVGRIKDELVFEVTKKSYHINPIRLFR